MDFGKSFGVISVITTALFILLVSSFLPAYATPLTVLLPQSATVNVGQLDSITIAPTGGIPPYYAFIYDNGIYQIEAKAFPSSYAYTYTPTTAGTHTITMKVYDSGNSSTTVSTTVIVENSESSNLGSSPFSSTQGNTETKPLKVEMRLLSSNSVVSQPFWVGCYAVDGQSPYTMTITGPPPLYGSASKTFNSNFGEVEWNVLTSKSVFFSCTVQDGSGAQASNFTNVLVIDNPSNTQKYAGQVYQSNNPNSNQVASQNNTFVDYNSIGIVIGVMVVIVVIILIIIAIIKIIGRIATTSSNEISSSSGSTNWPDTSSSSSYTQTEWPVGTWAREQKDKYESGEYMRELRRQQGYED